MQVAGLRSQLQTANVATQEARTASELTNREMEGLRNQEAELRRLIEDLVGANSAAVTKIQELRAERAELLVRLSAAEALTGRESAEMGALRGRIEEAEGKVSVLEAELVASQQNLRTNTVEADALRADLEVALAEAEMLRNSRESSGRVSELEDALERSAAALRGQRVEIEGLEAQLIIAQEETEEAVARLQGARNELLTSTRRAAEAEHAARLAALALSQMNEAYVQLSDERQQQAQEAERAAGEATDAERVKWEAEAVAQSGRVAILEAALETMRRQLAGEREEADTKDAEVRLVVFCSMEKQNICGLCITASGQLPIHN